MLVLVEREHQVAEYGLQIWHELWAGVLFKGGKSAAARLLHSLVVVQNHAQQLERRQNETHWNQVDILTPSIVGTKYWDLWSGEMGCVTQLAYRPRVQQVIDRTRGCRSLARHTQTVRGQLTLGSLSMPMRYGISVGRCGSIASMQPV